MIQANIDFFGKGQVQGQLASYIAQQGRINPAFMRPILGEDGHTYFTIYKGDLMPGFSGDRKKKESFQTYRRDELQHLGIQVNGTLRRDEWKQLDEAVLQASHIRLGGIQDLIDNNLVYNLTNPMGTTVLEHHTMGEAMEAEVSMDPSVRSRKDKVNYATEYLPIPVIHSDFDISSRTLEASRRLGNALDVVSVQEATRVVNEKLEAMLFNITDTPLQFGGGYIYSYLDLPSRNEYSIGTAWSADTGANILSDVLGMIAMSIAHRHYGPWMLYVPTAYQVVLGEDYTSGYPKSIRQRIMEVEGIKGIKIIDTLPADNVVLVEMQPNTVRLVQGMTTQVVQWQVGSSLSPTEYKVLRIAVPQIFVDQAGRCGIVHGSV